MIALGIDGFLNVADNVADGFHFLGGFVCDLDVKLFFDGHDEFDGVERVDFEVLHNAEVGGDFLFSAELLLQINSFPFL